MNQVFEFVDSVVTRASHSQMATYMIARTVLETEEAVSEYVTDGLHKGEIECEGSNHEVAEVVFFTESPGLICVVVISDYQSP